MFHNLKSIALFGLLLFTITPALTQNISKPVTFAFMIKNEKFWPQYNNNSSHLSQLDLLIQNNLSQIQSGHITVNIASYCNSFDTRAKNAELSRTRADNFKQALMARCGLQERQIKINDFVRSSSDILLVSLYSSTPRPIATQDQEIIALPYTLNPMANLTTSTTGDTQQIISYDLLSTSIFREVSFIALPNNVPPINLTPIVATSQATDTIKRQTITRVANEVKPPQYYLKNTIPPQPKPAKHKR